MLGRGKKIENVAAVAVLDPWVEQMEMLARRFATARDCETLIQLAPEIPPITAEMLRSDAGGGLVTRSITALDDALSVRVIQLVTQRHRLPGAAWSWLAFGSEGRREQTYVTDQDNGIIFSAADAAEARALRPLFMACADEVNQVLAACGFPLCKGGIMAGKAECCLSRDEWRERFIDWVRIPEPQALLNASIFFDFRCLYGDAELVEDLCRFLGHLSIGADRFMRMMAENALAAEPPLGVLREFSTREGVLDLKTYGSRIFVDVARILGLGSPLASTAQRLRHAAAQGTIPREDAEAAATAFQQLQRIRLQAQLEACAAGAEASNLIDPGKLNSFDRQVLHETLKQARQLQQRIKMTYRLDT